MPTVVCVLLMLITTPAWAGWMNMEETNDEIQYIDPDTIVRQDALRKVWQLTDRKKAGTDGIMSLRVFLEFNCADESYRMLELLAYSKPMASGEIVHSLTYGSRSEWSGVPERTVKERIALIACAF